MDRNERKENFKTYMDITHIGVWGFVLSILCVGIFGVLKFVFIGAFILISTFIIGNLYYRGGKIMFNPLQMLQDLKERHEALLKFLKLGDKLIPRHWEVYKLSEGEE